MMHNISRILMVLVALFFIVPSTTFAFQNEPDGFRTLYWGESLQEVEKNSEVQSLKYSGRNTIENSKEYTGVLNISSISGQYARDNQLKLSFWNNKLYRIEISFVGMNFSKMKEAMTLNFGEPEYDKTKWSTYRWTGNTTILELVSGGSTGSTKLIFVNPTLLEQVKKDGALSGW